VIARIVNKVPAIVGRWAGGEPGRYTALAGRVACSSLALIASLLSVGCSKDAAPISDGTYYGFELRTSASPDIPDAVWFNENVLTVQAGNVRLEKSPRYLLHGSVFASASDGGFRTFDGSVRDLGGRTLVALRQLTCDYCEPPPGDGPLPSRRSREYIALPNEDGTFELDHVRYSRDKNERPSWLTYQIEFTATE
jgi:hypothetical protein